MNAVVVALFLIGAPTFAVGVSQLQATLESWDYQRRAQD
ncbi:MAG: hypothetical protein QOF15_3295 [Mycobacterium sp.]|jgi:hypothetical protein|nr:hypothetical protein [Mycobacterium sp.]